MIAILADDFSGAAELAGIAAALGYKAEVQTLFDPSSDAEVIAVDTDTRLKSENEAAQIVQDVTRRIIAAKPSWIYKKTDSAMRGHIRVEIEAILDATSLEYCVFIPANPSKGRIIRGGDYFVDDVPLHQTVFASDPDFPRLTANVRELMGDSERILTPNATMLNDLRLELNSQALAAGAADFFTACLDRSLGFSPSPPPLIGLLRSREANPKQVLLLCGSLAAWDTGRAAQMAERGFVVKTLDDAVSPAIWRSTSKLMLAIGRPEKGDSAELTEKLIETALPLISGTQNDLRIGLEGGATAIDFIRRMGWTRLEVIPEGHVGVGSLRPPGGPVVCVKPGSYPWPADVFR